MCGRSVAGTIDTYRSNKLGAAGVIEFVAAPARVDVPQSVGCRCCLRYWHLHAERWRCMVDGVTRGWTDLRRAYANRCFTTLLSARPSCRFRWRYLRSSQADSGHRGVDDGGGSASRGLDHRWFYVALATTGVDVCALGRRRV